MIALGPDVVSWVTEKLNKHPNAFGVRAEGIGWTTRSGQMVAGVVYCNSNGHNLHAHIASDGSRRWLTRKFLRAMFAYPFIVLRSPRITATTADDNKAARQWLEKAGFEIEGVMLKAADGGRDLLIYRMFKDECPWLNL